MIKYRKFGVLILSLMILSVFAAVSVTALSEESDPVEDVPDLPLILYGELDVNGEPVSAGSEIMAYYEGELIAKSTVGEEGKYNLNLNLTPEKYTNIGEMELYVNGDEASFEIPSSQMEAIKDTKPGSIAEVDIECSASSTDRDTSSSSKDSSSGDSTGEAKIVKKDTAESVTSEKAKDSPEAGFAGEDEDGAVDAQGPVSQEGDEEGEDAEGAEDAGYSTVFTALLFVAALFGAFMIVKR